MQKCMHHLHTHAHARTHARRHARTHAGRQAGTQARTHTHTHTHNPSPRTAIKLSKSKDINPYGTKQVCRVEYSIDRL